MYIHFITICDYYTQDYCGISRHVLLLQLLYQLSIHKINSVPLVMVYKLSGIRSYNVNVRNSSENRALNFYSKMVSSW